MNGLPHRNSFRPLSTGGRRVGPRSLGIFTAFTVGIGALTMSGCAAVKPAALRVGDARISRDDVETDLKAYEKLIVALQPTAADRASILKQIHTDADGGKAWSAGYSSFILSNRIRSLATDAAYAETGIRTLPVSKEIRAKVAESLGGAKNFALLPKAIQERELRLAAQPAAIVAAKKRSFGTPEEFFKTHAERFVSEACTRHILVATKSAAVAIRQKIVAGADFAVEAKAKSIDKGSGANGGDLGCGDPAQFVPEFALAARTLKLGELSQPIQTQFGFHILQVKSRKAASFAASKNTIAGTMDTTAQTAAAAAVLAAAKDVSVDPSLGTIAADRSGFPSVIANATLDATGQLTTPAVRG